MTSPTTIRMRVIALLPKLAGPPEADDLMGCTEADLIELEKVLRFPAPNAFKNWLKVCNGALIGPGGVYGINTEHRSLDIRDHLESYPSWRRRHWVPIVGDGCGNVYVLVCRGNVAPVIFVDTMANPNGPAYVVGSDVWHFLFFLFSRELKKSKWPFAKKEVLKVDPAITKSKVGPLPWEA